MDDIVKRLRDHQNGGRRNECEEAAAEIESLRDKLRTVENDLAVCDAVLEAIVLVTDGEEMDDFMLSFPIVQKVYDLSMPLRK